MQQLIQDIKRKIDTDPYYAVTVIDSGGKRLYLNKQAPDILKEFGNAERFFESLFKSNDVFKIIERRKNGSSFKTTSQPHAITRIDRPLTTTVHNAEPMQGFSGLGGPMGLSGHEVIRLSVAEIEARRLQQELAELKPELKRLQQIEKDFELYKVQDQKTIEKSRNNAEMIGGLMQYLPQIGQALAGAFNQPKGLNAPETDPFITAYKSSHPEFKNFIQNVYSLISSSEDFQNEISELVTKHSQLRKA